LAGCGGDSNPAAPTPTPEPPSAALVVTVNAQPVAAGADPETHLARWDVVIRETAGVGGGVNLLNATIRDADSGASPEAGGVLILDGTLVTARAGSNRVPAGGSLTVPEERPFSLQSGSTRIVISVAVQLIDDNGHVVTGTGEAETH
jgi:hypothetical protein